MKKIFLLLSVGLSLIGKSQFNESDYHYDILKTNEVITVDGKLTEPLWSTVPEISTFWEHYPIDTIPSRKQYSLKLAYNDEYMFVGFICKDDDPKPIVQNLVRDDNGPFWSSDGLSIIIDPTNKNQSGYYFAMNAAGAKQDGTMSQQGFQSDLNIFWNAAWQGDVTVGEHGYNYEFAIPFSSMKYDADISTWGFNFLYNDMEFHSYNLWTRFPSAYHGLDFGYNGAMTFVDSVPEVSGKRLELKPAISISSEKDITQEGDIETMIKGGVDAKYAVTENLNLDMAVLPDFSTVEVDMQYIDFYRFEYNAPEQREFFLENNDLFALPGSDEDWSIVPWQAYRLKPFYTRRIGIKNWQHTPILYGSRLSGKATDNLRFGALNMQTQEYEDDPAQNYTAIGARQIISNQLSSSVLLLNRQSINYTGNSSSSLNEYNRNAGGEIDFSNKKKNLASSLLYYRSINTESNDQANMYGAEVDYFLKRFRTKSVFYRAEDNFIADIGYTPRLFHNDYQNDTVFRIGYSEASNYSNLSFYPGKKINIINFNSNLNTYYNNDYTNIDEYTFKLTAYLETNKSAGYYISGTTGRFNLHYANDVMKNDSPLNAGEYKDLLVSGGFNTSNSKKVSLSSNIEYGKFYNGKKLSTEMALSMRAQPWGVFTIKYNVFNYRLPDYDQEDTYHLLSARADINFTRNLSWTTLMQYNTQAECISVNSLFKWRFRPLSDFYFVIKDDADINFNQKKLMAVCKLTFWFKV